MDIPAATIATLISSSIATAVTLFINNRNSLKSLNDQLDNIIKISIQYPYLENPTFTASWRERMKEYTEDEYLRYDIYCNLIFNYMERLCKHHNYDEEKILNHVNIRDWIKVHRHCWESPSEPYENANGYSEKLKTTLANLLR